MNTETYKNIRIAYYMGILLLVLNTMPVARKYLASILDFQIGSGATIIMLVAAGVFAGAVMAYMRKFG